MEGEKISLREATAGDILAIMEIHNQGIEDRIATLDTEPHTLDEQLAWLHAHGPRHPIIVAEQNGDILGWASLNKFSPRSAYRFVADLSIYIERGWRGKGLGSLLLSSLIDKARSLGYHKIVLSAFPFNISGMRLYEKFGFKTVGIYKEQGIVDGKWVDTIIMEKLL